MLAEADARVVAPQAALRCILCRSRFLRLRRAALLLQARARGRFARRFSRGLRCLVRWQARCRGASARRAVRKTLAARFAAAVVIQRHLRGARARWQWRPLLPPPPVSFLQVPPLQEVQEEQPALGRCGAMRTTQQRPPQVPMIRGFPGHSSAGGSAAKENQPPQGHGAAPVGKRLPLSGGQAWGEAAAALAREAAAAAQKADAKEHQHQARMEAVQAQHDALRQYRVQMLRELAGARQAGVSPEARTAAAPQRMVSAPAHSSSPGGGGGSLGSVASRARLAVAERGPPAPLPLGRSVSPPKVGSAGGPRTRSPQRLTPRSQGCAAGKGSSGASAAARRAFSPGSAPQRACAPGCEAARRAVSPGAAAAGRALSPGTREASCGAGSAAPTSSSISRHSDMVRELLSRCGRIGEMQNRLLREAWPDAERDAAAEGSSAAVRETSVDRGGPPSRRAASPGVARAATRLRQAPSSPKAPATPTAARVLGSLFATPPSKRAAVTASQTRLSPGLRQAQPTLSPGHRSANLLRGRYLGRSTTELSRR
mmetsp:Transcript_31930/g.69840  ORF Transcript_31930/g.69840 Transcript_31930/m.69840 type:complete len:542 (+) Transcript_31930:3-1628(+)